MYIAELTVENFRCFGVGDAKLTLPFRAGLTALVGENDTGKTAVIDALRLAVGTRDQEYLRVQESDFHRASGRGEHESEMHIRCQFKGLTEHDRGAFAEYLTYVEEGDSRDAVLYVNCTAKNIVRARTNRRFVSVDVRSGANADGPTLDSEARHLLLCHLPSASA